MNATLKPNTKIKQKLIPLPNALAVAVPISWTDGATGSGIGVTCAEETNVTSIREALTPFLDVLLEPEVVYGKYVFLWLDRDKDRRVTINREDFLQYARMAVGDDLVAKIAMPVDEVVKRFGAKITDITEDHIVVEFVKRTPTM